MPTVDFLPVATAGGANVESQGAFAGSGHQTDGFQAGIAESAQVNKCLRQSSFVTAAIASLIATVTALNVLDDGTIGTLIEKLSMMISAVPFCGVSGGAANAQTIAPAVAHWFLE
jgi:hypothetical protein